MLNVFELCSRTSRKLHEYSTTHRILQAFALVLSVTIVVVVVLVPIAADDNPKVIP